MARCCDEPTRFSGDWYPLRPSISPRRGFRVHSAIPENGALIRFAVEPYFIALLSAAIAREPRSWQPSFFRFRGSSSELFFSAL